LQLTELSFCTDKNINGGIMLLSSELFYPEVKIFMKLGQLLLFLVENLLFSIEII
jgi:hypothetical protein